ncbi:voltage-gated potassium channel [Kineococcus xinjiangensis]|uniref:Voltage-gated potassium channel n=1 Tax=Kineococcus xinjiangensis TaxID=512762 RepID=A0A2S6IEP1_9ACTN|nr:hypothetical protein [Kineococcus xinjiangensis]PPK92671.1 voltage-gated potassium channel [Kineococcus xinjiangensis]
MGGAERAERERAEQERAEEERDLHGAELLARRLDTPMSVLGVVFLLVVLGQSLAQDPRLATALTVAGWVLWLVFALEFALRAYVAPDRGRFWRRNWWQLVFLLLPFLRFVRALSLLRFIRAGRVLRVGGVLSASIRGSRSAGRLLSSRVSWLGVLTAVVILGSSQALYLLGSYDDYAAALHAAALATIAGNTLSAPGTFARVLEVALAVYSVAIFATLAGALGAYFLEQREKPAPEPTPEPAQEATGSP